MLDKELRKFKDIVLVPAAKLIGHRVHPIAITVIGFLIGAAAMVFLYKGNFTLALVFWAVNRILDGLDGLVARISGKDTDIGGFLDIVADFFIYAAVPLVFAFRIGTVEYYRMAAVLLSLFYINASIWMSVSALLEKHHCEHDNSLTSLIMPRGVVEGFETIIFYTLMLLFPGTFIVIASAMAALLGVGIIFRLIQAVKLLVKLKDADA